MARSTVRGRKVGGSSHSPIIGRLTQRLAADELAAYRQIRDEQIRQARARLDAELAQRHAH